MQMPGRKYAAASSSYRYGFNGKENDNEITPDSYDYRSRIYDGRIGRWLSLDPLMKKYPNESNYAFVGNCPIIFQDADGKDKIIRTYHIDDKGIRTLISEQIAQKGVYDMGQGEDGFFYRRDIIQNITIQSSGKATYDGNSYGHTDRFATKTGRALANAGTDIYNFLNKENTGYTQEAGYSLSGGRGSTLEFRDKAGHYLGNLDLSTLFEAFAAAGSTESVEKLAEKFADKQTMEKIVLFAEKLKALQESGETLKSAIEGAKKLLEKNEPTTTVCPDCFNGDAHDGVLKKVYRRNPDGSPLDTLVPNSNTGKPDTLKAKTTTPASPKKTN